MADTSAFSRRREARRQRNRLSLFPAASPFWPTMLRYDSAPSAPTGIVVSNSEVDDDQDGAFATLFMVGGAEPGTFSIVTGPEWLSVDGNTLVADGTQTESTPSVTLKVVDGNDNEFTADPVTFDVVASISSPVDPGEGEIVIPDPEDPETDQGGFEEAPVQANTSDGLKITGKNGGSAAFLRPLAMPDPGGTLTIRYTFDGSQMSRGGSEAAFGLVMKAGNSVHFTTLRGNGNQAATVMLASHISGDFRKANQFTVTNDGAAQDASKAGPNYVRLVRSFDGLYSLYAGNDLESLNLIQELRAPSPLAGMGDTLEFGFGGVFTNQDTGVFQYTVNVLEVVAAGDDFFADDGATFPWYGNATYSNAFYDSGTDTTWIAWEAWTGSTRHIRARAYNHTTEEWGANCHVANSPLTDNDHGVPALVRDADGYVHCFYGAHNSNMRHAVTAAPDNPSLWIRQSDISGDYTYPHPVLVGSDIYLFLRLTDDPLTDPRPLVLYKSSSISSGVVTWGSEIKIADPGGSDRFYAGQVLVSGTELHIVATISDSGDTTRDDIFYLIYETSDGSVKNFAGTTTVASGSLPVARSSLDSNFRLVDTGSDNTDIPGLCFDTDGNPHVFYALGPKGDFTLYHTMHNGSNWTSAVEVGSAVDPFPFLAVVPLAAGVVEMWWAEDDADDWDRGGSITRRVRQANGTLGSTETLLEPATRALTGVMHVRSGHDDARVIFCEVAPQPREDSDAGDLRLFLYGAAGLIAHTEPTPDEADAQFASVALVVNAEGDDEGGTDEHFANVALVANLPTVEE